MVGFGSVEVFLTLLVSAGVLGRRWGAVGKFGKINGFGSGDSGMSYTPIRYNSSTTELVGNRNMELDSVDMKQELLDIGSNVVAKEEVVAMAKYDFSSLTHTLARMLTDLHDFHHVPWFVLIAGTSLAVKLAVAPFQVYGASISAKIAQEEKVVQSIRDSIPQSKDKTVLVGAAVKKHYASKNISTGKMIASLFIQVSIIGGFVDIKALI